MSSKIISTDQWNKDFFKTFVELRNRVQRETDFFIPDTLATVKKVFGPEVSFGRHHHWKCWILFEDHRPVARLGCSFPKDQPLKFAPLGFYESDRPSQEGLVALLQEAEAWAKDFGVEELRLPMQGGFFGSYRARLASDEAPFFGEPETLPRYFSEWEVLGFKPCGRWQNFEMNKENLRQSCVAAVRRFYDQDSIPGVTFVPIGAGGIDQDLLKLRELFLDSYRGFSDFMTVSEEEFLEMYRPYRHIFSEKFCFFIQKDQRTLGFCLSFFDPLPAFLQVQNNLGWLPQKLKDLLSLLHYRRGIQKLYQSKSPKKPLRFFVPYIGKTSDAKDVKALLAAIQLKLIEGLPESCETYFWQYVSEVSDTKKTLREGTYRTSTQFLMFQKSLQ